LQFEMLKLKQPL